MQRKSYLFLGICLSLLLAAVLVLAGCGQKKAGPETKEKVVEKAITMRAVSFLPPPAGKSKIYGTLIEKINDQAKGKLSIDWIGGPEIFPPYELGAAVRQGVIDMAWVPSLAGTIPGMEIFNLSQKLPSEERKEGGAYEYLVELAKKEGLYYLGRTAVQLDFFSIFLKDPIDSPEDLAGLRIAAQGVPVIALRGVGANPVDIKEEDMYSALQTGLIDGLVKPVDQIFVGGFHEVAKYMVDHSFLQAANATIINLDTWNSIPADVQQIIMKNQVEMEQMALDMMDELIEKERNKLSEAGMQFIKFSDAEGKKFIEDLENAVWEYAETSFPKLTPDLKKHFLK